MSTAAQKPGSLLDQWNLLGEVISAPWSKGLDMEVAHFVIDHYFARHGNARASLRQLEKATRTGRNRIAPALRKLVDHGVFSVTRKGMGTRATEYALNFNFKAEQCSGSENGRSISGSENGPSTGSETGSSRP
jgi:hypothetical protein